VYYIYDFIVVPLYKKWQFQKYPNVMVSKRFIPLFGDFLEFAQNIEKGKAYYDHIRYEAKEMVNYDLRVVFEGNSVAVKAVSLQARKELQSLIPNKIDRFPFYKGFARIILDSCVMKRSTKGNMERLKLFLNELSMKSSSKYLPTMVLAIQNVMSHWKQDKTIGAVLQMNEYTFAAFNMVLFGKNIDTMTGKMIPYHMRDGSIKDMSFKDTFFEIVHDHIVSFLHPATSLAPFLSKYNLINPFKRDHHNLNQFKAYIKEMISKTDDENSICRRILAKSKIDKNDLVGDFVGFIFAGAETASHCLTVALYHLKKYPEVLEKLMKHLADNGFNKYEDNYNNYTLEKISDLDYLTYVIKESLRIDGPAIQSLSYQCYEDVTVCGVPLKKGQEVRFEQLAIHYDENEWKKPFEFIPERFDPESEYYGKPGAEGKNRTPLSHVPFSFGSRVCAGSSFAMLELKVGLTYMLTHMDFDVDQEFMAKEGVGFAVGSEIELEMHIKKIKHSVVS
jgi:cytochrome P450